MTLEAAAITICIYLGCIAAAMIECHMRAQEPTNDRSR